MSVLCSERHELALLPLTREAVHPKTVTSSKVVEISRRCVHFQRAPTYYITVRYGSVAHSKPRQILHCRVSISFCKGGRSIRWHGLPRGGSVLDASLGVTVP